MKKWIFMVLLLIPKIVPAQNNATNAFQVSGLVEQPQMISFEDSQQFRVHKIGDVKITSHNGEPRGELRKLRGVRLRDVLTKVGIRAENPKVLSEYYIICRATDDYK